MWLENARSNKTVWFIIGFITSIKVTDRQVESVSFNFRFFCLSLLLCWSALFPPKQPDKWYFFSMHMLQRGILLWWRQENWLIYKLTAYCIYGCAVWREHIIIIIFLENKLVKVKDTFLHSFVIQYALYSMVSSFLCLLFNLPPWNFFPRHFLFLSSSERKSDTHRFTQTHIRIASFHLLHNLVKYCIN